MDNRNDTFIGSRWFYAICFAGLFVVETLIALFVRDAFIRPYMGDVSGYYLEDITKYINWRPRKRLGFLSPEEAVEFPSIDKFLKYKEKWK